MKKISSLGFWFIFLIYMEVILKLALFDKVLSFNLINMILFLIPIAIVLKIFTSLGSKKFNKIVTYVVTSSLTIIFIAQLVYYKTYLSVFSIYSMGKAEQLLDYVDTILKIIMRNIGWIILLLFPLVILVFLYQKIMDGEKDTNKDLIILLVSVLFFQITAVLSLSLNDNETYSAKVLYYDTHSPTLSTNKLGLLTTMRIDLKRLVFGFKEKSLLGEKPVNNDDDDDDPIVEKPPVIEYNVMDINFDELIANENNQTIKDMHTYFKMASATPKNEYTGKFKGKNLIVFLAESFDPIAIDKNLTPTLYKLYNEGFKFTNFYTPLYPVSTTDGEYITVTSLIPKEGVWSAYRSSSNYFPFVLGNSFKGIGYKTTAYHDHTATYYYRYLSHPNYGYDFYACKRGLNINCNRWPESDVEMIDATYNSYMQSSPFLTYYITVSGHLRYTKSGNSIAYKNWSYVENLPYSNSVKAYMACHVELDKAIEKLIKYLSDAGKLDDTVIAISADHYPYGLTLDEINEKSSYVRDDNFEKHRSHFIIWNSKTEPITIDKIGSSLDILPTLLNLFGVTYDSRLLMGKDLLSDTDPLVIFSNRSFITDKGRYNAITGTFDKNDGVTVSPNYVKEINQSIYDKFYLSRQILESDYYRKVFKP